ncbi:MAG: hypothetical protein Q9193_001614 [Seirophora villosa]
MTTSTATQGGQRLPSIKELSSQFSSIRELPSIVIIQGSFVKPFVYTHLRHSLRKEGYQVYQPVLATCSNIKRHDFPRRTVGDDVANISAYFGELITKEQRIVVVIMHGYGGIAGTEALCERWSLARRQAFRLEGGISHLFYYSAFLLEKGQSIFSTWGMSPTITVEPDGRCYVRNGIKALYSDLTEEQYAAMAREMVPQSHGTFLSTAIRGPCWYIPSTYVVGEADRAMSVKLQRKFAEMAGAKVRYCDWGHSPHMSHPDWLVEEIKAVIERI